MFPAFIKSVVLACVLIINSSTSVTAETFSSSCYVFGVHQCTCEDQYCGKDLCEAPGTNNVWTEDCGSCNCNAPATEPLFFNSSCYIMDVHQCACEDQLCGEDLCEAPGTNNIWSDGCGNCTCTPNAVSSTPAPTPAPTAAPTPAPTPESDPASGDSSSTMEADSSKSSAPALNLKLGYLVTLLSFVTFAYAI